MNRIIFLLLLLYSSQLIGQEHSRIQTDSLLFWQPDTKLTMSDYQQMTDSIAKNYKDKYDKSALSAIQIKGVIDIPQTKKMRRKNMGKAYFAPAF